MRQEKTWKKSLGFLLCFLAFSSIIEADAIGTKVWQEVTEELSQVSQPNVEYLCFFRLMGSYPCI